MAVPESILEKIPHLPQDKAEPLHQAAQQSVGSLSGAVAESLVRDLVTQVRHCEQAEQNMRPQRQRDIDLRCRAIETRAPHRNTLYFTMQ